MNLLFRVLYVLIASFFKSRIHDVLATGHLRLRVLPNDLDFNMHMNNGRYLTIMDLGRLDLIMRSGLMRIMLQQKSVPILASAKIRYRLSLDPFQAYDLQTQIVGWDDKWFFIEQRFILGSGPKQGQIAAIGLVKGCFYNNKTRTTVPSADVLSAIGYTSQSPELPQHILDWQKAEDSLREITRQG